MQIDKKKIERGLKKKGFRAEPASHMYFYFYYKGKQSSISTYTSHGSSKYKVYGDTLLALMKKQLELDTVQDLADLIRCPMTEAKYIEILKSKGFLIETSEPRA